MLKELYERLMYLMTVPKCVCCGEKLSFYDRCLCPSCLSEYEAWKGRNCSVCTNLLPYCTCSNYYLKTHYVHKVIKVYRYKSINVDTPQNRVIYALKQSNRSDVFDFLAEELSESITNNLDLTDKEGYVITNVPRRPRAIRKFGYDHAKVLAKRVGKILGIEYRCLLVSRAKKAQKKLYKYDRRRNAKFRYKRKNEIDLSGKTVIIVDDIITTGASVGIAAAMIRALGTKKLIGASVGIAYKDMYDRGRKRIK